MELSWCTATEKENWKEPPELAPHMNSASAFVTGTLFTPSCFPFIFLTDYNPTDIYDD